MDNQKEVPFKVKICDLTKYYYCTKCNSFNVVSFHGYNKNEYCGDCGQKLDWEGVEW